MWINIHFCSLLFIGFPLSLDIRYGWETIHFRPSVGVWCISRLEGKWEWLFWHFRHKLKLVSSEWFGWNSLFVQPLPMRLCRIGEGQFHPIRSFETKFRLKFENFHSQRLSSAWFVHIAIKYVTQTRAEDPNQNNEKKRNCSCRIGCLQYRWIRQTMTHWIFGLWITNTSILRLPSDLCRLNSTNSREYSLLRSLKFERQLWLTDWVRANLLETASSKKRLHCGIC